jgi:hypothetical protein
MATALATLPPAPVSRAREGRDEQHMNLIPKGAPARQKCKMPAAGADLPSVLRERQSVLVRRKGLLPDIVVPLPQATRRDPIAWSIPEPRQKLANAQISCCNIRYNRI